jgi:hypothetical protein
VPEAGTAFGTAYWHAMFLVSLHHLLRCTVRKKSSPPWRGKPQRRVACIALNSGY